MYLSHLQLTNFRSYESLDLVLRPGVSVFLGPNGYGKTNLVEAVYFLATLGSHRVGSDQPLVKTGCEAATVRARVQAGVEDDRALSVGVDIRTGVSNRAMLNRAPVRPREILGAVRTVFFAPEDLAIVRGDPLERRRFIDDLVVSRWPRMAGVRSDYERALKQKTALLKALSGRSLRTAGAGAEETLSSWDEVIAHLGGEIVATRLRTLADIAPMVEANYGVIAPGSSMERVSYSSSWVGEERSDVDGIREALAEKIAERRGEEIARGVCLVGPHRDDVTLSLGDLPVRGYASHGEAWSYALSLRLASLDLLHEDGVEPILILDDVFAELDEKRRSAVVEAMDSVEQALVTVAVLRDLPYNLQGCIFEVGPGRVSLVSPE